MWIWIHYIIIQYLNPRVNDVVFSIWCWFLRLRLTFTCCYIIFINIIIFIVNTVILWRSQKTILASLFWFVVLYMKFFLYAFFDNIKRAIRWVLVVKCGLPTLMSHMMCLFTAFFILLFTSDTIGLQLLFFA